MFFPTNPEAKILSYLGASSNDTRPYQHLAQGYALSGSTSSLTELSSLYPMLITPVNDQMVEQNFTTATMSGYYFPDSITIYPSASTSSLSSLNASSWYAPSATWTGYVTKNPMLPNNSNANVILDESFSNTFNNAKHCNTNYSGRKRLVSIYKASTTENGESFPGDTSGFGLGFTSTNIFDIERNM